MPKTAVEINTKTRTSSTRQPHPRNRVPDPEVQHPFVIIQRARVAPESLTRADVLQLQSTIGNQAVGRLLAGIGRFPSRQASVQRQPEDDELLQGKMTDAIQRQPVPEEEEELLQGRFTDACIQCQAPEEEELVQGKFEPVQQQGPEEEEELLQGKFASDCIQCQVPEEEELMQGKELIQQAQPNRTGMSDHLKSGLETLSGMDLSGVRVQYSSSKPAQLNALAYTQGQEIHVAPGQERHLPHEGWHAVQQMQGRVKPTMQMMDGVPVNDDAGLEREADVMGTEVLQMAYDDQVATCSTSRTSTSLQRQRGDASPFVAPQMKDAQQTNGNTKDSVMFSALAPIQRYCVLPAGNAITQSHRLTGATSQYDAQNKTYTYQPVWSNIPQGQVSLRVADQGGLAVPHTGQDEFETFFARPVLLDSYNQNLQNTAFTLVPNGGNAVTTPVNPLAPPNDATEQLQEVAVDLNHGANWQEIRDDCNHMATKVTGSRNTTNVEDRDIPEIGEALYIKPLKEKLDHKWNYHWAGVVAKVGSDVVTLENYARGNVEEQLEKAKIKAEKGWGIVDWLFGVKRIIAGDGLENRRYYFSMHGPDHNSQGTVTNPKQSFEAEWATKFPGTGVTTNIKTHQALQRQAAEEAELL